MATPEPSIDGLHRDLYHQHWISHRWQMVGKVSEFAYQQVRSAIVHHKATEPHAEGQCANYDLNLPGR